MAELRPELQAEVDAITTTDRLALSVPLHVLLGESIDLAAYARRVWEPTDDHPGLSSAARRFDENVADDLSALVAAVLAEHTAFRLAAEPPVSKEVIERGEALIDELTAVLDFLFDDGIEDERDAQLAAISDLYGTRSRSDDALAAALFDFAALAQENRDALEGLGGFDVANINEATTLAEQIRARSAESPTERAEAATAHRIRRDQITAVQDRKVKLIRAAARFAFRKHPALAREAGSAYGRRTRASRRRAQAGSTEASTTEPTADE